jgi:hypothetical protein
MQPLRAHQKAAPRSEAVKLPAKASIEMENILSMLCEERCKLDEIIASVE